MMVELLKRDALTDEMVNRVAAEIAAFQSEAGRTEEIVRLGGLEAVKINVDEDFDQTRKYIGITVTSEQYSSLQAYSQVFIEVKEAVIRQRESSGTVRDCHGDLHTAQICMENGISVIDCIEFNERFRYSDVACDIAFLAMDLDCNERPDLSRLLVDTYVQKSGDEGVREFMDFYKKCIAHTSVAMSPALTGTTPTCRRRPRSLPERRLGAIFSLLPRMCRFSQSRRWCCSRG